MYILMMINVSVTVKGILSLSIMIVHLNGMEWTDSLLLMETKWKIVKKNTQILGFQYLYTD